MAGKNIRGEMEEDTHAYAPSFLFCLEGTGLYDYLSSEAFSAYYHIYGLRKGEVGSRFTTAPHLLEGCGGFNIME
jgi:hypothetical protein